MILTIDEAIEKYETLKHENMTAAAEWYQKYLNYQDHEYKAFGRKCDKEAGKYKQLADWLKELKELREKVNCSEKLNSLDDLISRQVAIDAFEDTTFTKNEIRGRLLKVPSVQPKSCGDAVNRNAIIRALNTMDRYVSDELTLCNTDRKFPKNEVFIVDDVYEEIVERLPSVQPDPCGGEQ